MNNKVIENILLKFGFIICTIFEFLNSKNHKNHIERNKKLIYSKPIGSIPI